MSHIPFTLHILRISFMDHVAYFTGPHAALVDASNRQASVAFVCSVLQCVAVCCSICCSVLQCVAVRYRAVPVDASNRQASIAVSCSVLQYVAVCCCVL